MKPMLFIIAILFCSLAVADITARDGLDDPSGRPLFGSKGQSWDQCLARWEREHANDKTLTISTQPKDAHLVFMSRCTGSNSIVSQNPEQNKDLAARLVQAWAKVRTADNGAGTVRRIEIVDSSPNSVQVPVVQGNRQWTRVQIQPGELGGLFPSSGTYTFTRTINGN